MLLYFLSNEKQNGILQYPFIREVNYAHDNLRLKEFSAEKFLDNISKFKKQLVPKIISEFEYSLLVAIVQNCDGRFDYLWSSRFNKSSIGKSAFQTEKSESPFSEYSSKGWKIHIAFIKRKEKEIGKFLFEHGLYFKINVGIGTYFDGNLQSGATIYIGSYDNMVSVAHLLHKKISNFLEIGAHYIIEGRKIPMGSGSDIQIMPNIMARFDVAKTRFGWMGVNKSYKYSEHGLPTWSNRGVIPILKKYESQVAEAVNKWNSLLPRQRKIYIDILFKNIYEESKSELIKDFGKEFVFGK